MLVLDDQLCGRYGRGPYLGIRIINGPFESFQGLGIEVTYPTSGGCLDLRCSAAMNLADSSAVDGRKATTSTSLVMCSTTRCHRSKRHR